MVDLVLHHLKTRFVLPQREPQELPPPPRERVDITQTLWIGPIPEQAAQRVFQTCRPGVHGFERSKIHCPQLYAYGKEVPPELARNKEQWDEDGTLQGLVAISRLVHPTSASLRTAARLEMDSTGEASWVSQAKTEGVQSDAFVSPDQPRDWLTPQDLETLKTIAHVLDGRLLVGRVWRALWYHEYAARSYEMDVRWPMVVTGLEALLKTERNDLGNQFRRRTLSMAKELCIVDYTEKDASDAWDMRSGLTHGQNLGKVTAENLRLYVMIELILRTAALKALREKEFGAIFENDSAIRDRWHKT